MSGYGRGDDGRSEDLVDLHKSFKYLLAFISLLDLFLDDPQKQVLQSQHQVLSKVFSVSFNTASCPNPVAMFPTW